MKNTKHGGIIGGILDEYQYSIKDLIKCLANISDEQLKIIVDSETKNKDCISIQSILTHIIYCGKNYLLEIAYHKGEVKTRKSEREYFDTVQEYISELEKLNDLNVDFFESRMNSEMQNFAADKKLTTRWGQLYDYEQIMEHAIVHVYRHRRQIEGFVRIIEGS